MKWFLDFFIKVVKKEGIEFFILTGFYLFMQLFFWWMQDDMKEDFINLVGIWDDVLVFLPTACLVIYLAVVIKDAK